MANTVSMKICIIYPGDSGNTRYVAQHLASACDELLVETVTGRFFMNLILFYVVQERPLQR
jgi:hypothetical protein